MRAVALAAAASLAPLRAPRHVQATCARLQIFQPAFCCSSSSSSSSSRPDLKNFPNEAEMQGTSAFESEAQAQAYAHAQGVTLGLPMPEPQAAEQDAKSGEEGASHQLDLSGGQDGVSLDHLGPMVVNVDGTLSRISNWGEMADVEKKNTMRILGKRNNARLKALKEKKGE